MATGRYYYLKRVSSNVEQNEFIPLKDNEVELGRKEMPGEHISRKHARLKRSGEAWTITNLSQNGVLLNGEFFSDKSERPLTLGSVIQFGQPDIYVYRFKAKMVEQESKSRKHRQNKKCKLDTERYGENSDLSHEQAVLEKQLRESDVLQARLQEERDQLHNSLQQQQNQLQQKYAIERNQLEQQFASGALAQQVLLEEKESLARNLETQVCELQSRLASEKRALEERLNKEEEEHARILQEKENVMLRLEEENARRAHLEEQLKTTETHKEELQQQVEAITSSIRIKEAEQQATDKERQRHQEELAKERARLMQELEAVKTTLVEKEMTNALLDSEVREKEELRSKLASVEQEMKTRIAEEVERSAALVHQQTNKQMEELMGEKSKLEEQLQAAKAQDQEHRSKLEDDLHTLEAQKMSLEQELLSFAVSSKHAKQEVVESVSNVLENEFQCPICNDLFIRAVMLGCSHTFCQYCIDQWKKNKRDCPNCRKHITSETRSLVVDNFIEKIVPTLSEDMQRRRAEIVNERKAAMEAAALAQARAAEERAAAAAQRGGRRGRGRGRGGGGRAPRSRQAQREVQTIVPQDGRSSNVHRPPNPPNPPVVQPVQPLNPPVVEPVVLSSDSDSDNSLDRMSDSSSVSGDEFAYYGGYGRCYNCGRRGHWANGCTDY